MSMTKTGNATHDTTVNKAEAVRQAAVVPGATKAVVVAAETTFYRAAVTSAIANGIAHGQLLTALRELGNPCIYP